MDNEELGKASANGIIIDDHNEKLKDNMIKVGLGDVTGWTVCDISDLEDIREIATFGNVIDAAAFLSHLEMNMDIFDAIYCNLNLVIVKEN